MPLPANADPQSTNLEKLRGPILSLVRPTLGSLWGPFAALGINPVWLSGWGIQFSKIDDIYIEYIQQQRRSSNIDEISTTQTAASTRGTKIRLSILQLLGERDLPEPCPPK